MTDLPIPDGLDVPKTREYVEHEASPRTRVVYLLADAAITELLGLLAERDADLRTLAEDVGTYHAGCTCYACQRRRSIATDLRARATDPGGE